MPGLLRALGEQLAGPLGLLHRRQLRAARARSRRPRRPGARRVVVDQLREHAAVGAKDRQARALGAAAHLRPDAAAAAQPAAVAWSGRPRQARLPTLRRDVLARVADALALVGLRRPGAADPRGDLADELLVDAPDHDLRSGCGTSNSMPSGASPRPGASSPTPARAPCPAAARGSRRPGSRAASRSRSVTPSTMLAIRLRSGRAGRGARRDRSGARRSASPSSMRDLHVAAHGLAQLALRPLDRDERRARRRP